MRKKKEEAKEQELETEELEEPVELRITFTTMGFNVAAVLTAIEEEAFKRNLPVSSTKIGGFLEQTYGVIIKGNQEEVNQFESWFKENVGKLSDTSVAKFLKGM